MNMYVCSSEYFCVFAAVLSIQLTIGQAVTLPPPFLPLNEVGPQTTLTDLLKPLPTLVLDAGDGSGEEVADVTSQEPIVEPTKQLPLVEQLEKSEMDNLGSKPGVYAFANYKDFEAGFGFVRSDKKHEQTVWEKLLDVVVKMFKVKLLTNGKI